jgi:hypothetical protein
VEDVVAQHCQRNRPPRLPDNAQLMAVQDRQMSGGPCGVSRSRSATQEVAAPANPPSCAVAPPLPSAINSTSRLSTAIRSVSGSQSDNGDASQLSFYTPTVRDIIEHPN